MNGFRGSRNWRRLPASRNPVGHLGMAIAVRRVVTGHTLPLRQSSSVIARTRRCRSVIEDEQSHHAGLQ
jgi:hypothetical protein